MLFKWLELLHVLLCELSCLPYTSATLLFPKPLDNILGKVNPIPVGEDYDDVVVELGANGQPKRAGRNTLRVVDCPTLVYS